MVIIEHFAGAFPTWLAPTQAIVIPVTDKHNDYAQRIADEMIDEGLRVTVDARSERMNYKIRNAQEQQIPYMLIVGDKELEHGSVNVRYRRGEAQAEMSVADFTTKIRAEIKARELESTLLA